MERLTDEEIRALLDHPWDVDYQSLDPQHFWQKVLDYLPAALASEARTRLADVIGEAANLLQVRPLEFSSLLESHPIFLQKAFSSCGVGARYFAYASCGLTDKQRSKIFENVSRRTTDIQRILDEPQGPTPFEIADARRRIMEPIEWLLRAQLNNSDLGPAGTSHNSM